MKPHKTFNTTMVYNILGDTPTTNDWLASLKKLKYKEAKDFESDEFNDTLDKGLGAGLPVLLVAGTSMGKTTRVREMAAKKHWTLIQYNLSQADRVSIRGIPTPAKFGEELFDRDDADSTLAADVVKFFDTKENPELNLPQEVTAYRPDVLLRDALDAALAKKPPAEILLFFDECNRVSDPVIMTSVFEAISNNRFMGVTWAEGRVHVVAACNLPDPHPAAETKKIYKDADEKNSERYSVSPMDPAFAARFMISRKHVVDESDYESYLEYVNGTKNGKPMIDPTLAAVMKKMGFKNYKEMIHQIKLISEEKNVATPRAIENVSTFLKGCLLGEDAYMKGMLVSVASDFSTISHKEVLKRMQDPSWVGHRNDAMRFSIESPPGSDKYYMMNGKDVIGAYQKFGGEPSRALVRLWESLIKKKRRDLWQLMLGKSSLVTNTFAEAYNVVEQGRILEVTDLTTGDGVKLTGRFIGQKLGTKQSEEDLVNLIISILQTHTSSYTGDDIYQVFKTVTDKINSVVMNRSFAEKLAKHPDFQILAGMGFSDKIADALTLLFANVIRP